MPPGDSVIAGQDCNNNNESIYIAPWFQVTLFKGALTVVPATAGHRWFRGKVALRGRWPLVTGNGHMRHYVKSNTHIRQQLFHSTCTTL